MKLFRFTKTVLIAMVALVALTTVAAAPQTFTGTVSDTMCKAKHMLPGKSDTECTLTCIKANAKYALVEGKQVYALSGGEDDLARMAGKRVRVTGEKVGETIKVQTVTAADK